MGTPERAQEIIALSPNERLRRIHALQNQYSNRGLGLFTRGHKIPDSDDPAFQAHCLLVLEASEAAEQNPPKYEMYGP